jgi:hypothetical protein
MAQNPQGKMSERVDDEEIPEVHRVEIAMTLIMERGRGRKKAK